MGCVIVLVWPKFDCSNLWMIPRFSSQPSLCELCLFYKALLLSNGGITQMKYHLTEISSLIPQLPFERLVRIHSTPSVVYLCPLSS